MYIFEITTPGTWLDYQDREWSWKIESQLSHLKSQFFEANLALNLFLAPLPKKSQMSHQDEWEKDSRLRTEIKQEIEAKYDSFALHENWENIHFETEIKFKRTKWRQGHIPKEFTHNQKFIFAKAFLYALDAFNKFLKVLYQEDNVPENIKDFYDEFGEVFPNFKSIRNTTQHLEDRSRGLGSGRNPQPMDLQPINNQIVNAENGGVLMLNVLNGTKYGCTMADGHYGEIDVSPESMEKLQTILQKTLESFSWKGPNQHDPNV